MRKILLTISYDGTNYHGWQKQNNAKTIEDILNKTISLVFNENIQIIGTSRTDCGVHARKQIAVFYLNCNIDINNIPLAINSKLPDDIHIINAKHVSDNFHPRYTNLIKTYKYYIFNSKIDDVLHNKYHYFYPHFLDIKKMKKAAKVLIGEHDFISFCCTKSDVKNTVRFIKKINIEKRKDMITLTFIGNGFLYKMIRNIVGILIKIGNLKEDVSYLRYILEKKQKGCSRYIAPAKGLCLYDIKYIK